MQTFQMKFHCLISILTFLLACNNQAKDNPLINQSLSETQFTQAVFPENSWQYFLQNLIVKDAPIVDYTGKQINNQAKHFAIIDYDVGTSDLQQCADALIRLRSEYLFSQKRYDEIGFHFCNGAYYSWNMYSKGLRPAFKGNNMYWLNVSASEKTHASLRKYLNIVYAYASTISLCKELKPANDFTVGSVIIAPGSPGHTCIIIDEATDTQGRKMYKIAEGYMPAQSIYILSNPYNENINPWYYLTKGEVITASCDFISYQLKKFE
jgi:hypothetical protein